MIKQTLYKRNANGTVNQWSIIIENDGFEPHNVNNVQVIIPKVQNITKTNNTTIIENITNDIIDVANNTWNNLVGDQNV